MYIFHFVLIDYEGEMSILCRFSNDVTLKSHEEDYWK